MRYLKSTAFLLLAIGSSVSVLSRSAIAQIAEEADSASLTDDPLADLPKAAAQTAKANTSQPLRDLGPLLDSVKRSAPSNLLESRIKDVVAPLVADAQPPHFSELARSTSEETSQRAPELAANEAPADASNRLSLDQFRALAEQAYSPQADGLQTDDLQTDSPEAGTTEIAVADRTASQNSSEQIAQAEDLPVLEEGTPPTAAPGDPIPSDPGVPDLLPNDGIESGPDVVQPIPDDAPVEGAEPELGDLPDILFADPNPLNLPATLEGVEVERNPVVTLEQAVELAYRNSQALQTAILQEEQAAAAVREQRAARLPTVSVGSTLESVEREATTGFVNPFTGEGGAGVDAGVDTTLSGNLTVDYDLITGGARAASIQAAELQQQVAALAVETQQEQLRLVTANNYYALQEAGENIRIQRSFLEEAERNLRDSRLRQEVGVGTRFDTLRAEVQYANARQQLIQSQGDQRIARRDIARLLNLPPNAGLQATPVAVAENWGLTLEESILLAYENRAELEQQLLRADINEEQRKIALAAVRPRVSLFANYRAQDQLSDDGTDRGDFLDNYSFGARFNWLLFDGGAARASSRQQEIASQIEEEQFGEQSDQIRFDVEQAYFNLETNQENIATSRIAVSQAEEALELANLRLQAGVGTQLDVLTAQSELTQAQANNVTAILNYNRALAAMQRAVSNIVIN